MEGPKLKVIVIPEGRCNMSCGYCYISAPTGGSMNDKILYAIFDKVFHYNGTDSKSEFIWHGFEPLLAGINFYENVIKIQKQEFGHFPVLNCIQTNGTLLTKEYVKFFVANGFRIGISLDGPQFIHDEYRKYPNGNGTFADVMKGIDLIRELGGDVGVIGVLTPFSITHIAEIYHFFRGEKLDFDLLPITPVKEDLRRGKILRLSPKEYAIAAINLFNMWFSDTQPPQIRSCDSWTLATLGIPIGQECTFCGDCFVRVINVDPIGNVWPCERFNSVNGFRFGNILVDSLNDVIIPRAEELLTARRKVIAESCNACYPLY